MDAILEFVRCSIYSSSPRQSCHRKYNKDDCYKQKSYQPAFKILNILTDNRLLLAVFELYKMKSKSEFYLLLHMFQTCLISLTNILVLSVWVTAPFTFMLSLVSPSEEHLESGVWADISSQKSKIWIFSSFSLTLTQRYRLERLLWT